MIAVQVTAQIGEHHTYLTGCHHLGDVMTRFEPQSQPYPIREDGIPEFDTPSPARLYDGFLGGAHTTAADRQLIETLVAANPMIPYAARANRAFLRRAVHYMAAELGIRAFLDLGAGIPAVGAVHEVAQSIDPACRVVYMDADPVAWHLTRQIIDAQHLRHVMPVLADLRESDTLLSEPAIASLLATGQPIGVLAVAVMHFIADDDVLAPILAAAPSGSVLAISHACTDGQDEELGEHGANLYQQRSTSSVVYRSREQVTALFAGWMLRPPGLMWTSAWPSDHREPGRQHPDCWAQAGLAIKP
jgi:hypothetical protein